MKVETQRPGCRSITFIVPDNANEARDIEYIAHEGKECKATIEPKGLYFYPYLKIIYEGVVK